MGWGPDILKPYVNILKPYVKWKEIVENVFQNSDVYKFHYVETLEHARSSQVRKAILAVAKEKGMKV